MKLKKGIIIAAGVVVVLIVFLFGGLYWFSQRIMAETRQMQPLETGQVLEGIYAIKDSYVNAYIINCGESLIAVDSGQTADSIQAGIRNLGFDPLEVAAVFLTHSDSDHVGGIQIFKNAKVYLSQAEEQMINGKTARFAFFMKNTLPVPYLTLQDQQEVQVGSCTIKGVSTPGHTPGSMSYIVNGKYLFSGDTLSIKNGRAGLFNRFFNMDSAREMSSIQQISQLQGIEVVFTAHYGYAPVSPVLFEKITP